jgi:hypothetical protein
MIETSHTTAKLQLKALALGCPQLAVVFPSEGQASLEKE